MPETLEDNRYFMEYLLLKPEEWDKYQKYKKEKERNTSTQKGGNMIERATTLAAHNRSSQTYYFAGQLEKVEKLIEGILSGRIKKKIYMVKHSYL